MKKINSFHFYSLMAWMVMLLSAAPLFALDYSGVSPIFTYGEWEKLKYYTNLAPSADNYHLDLDNESYGFVINTKGILGAGLGVSSNISEKVLSTKVIVDIGLAPVFKAYASFVNRVDTMKEADDKFQMIPWNRKTLDQYKTGDAARFEMSGGVIFKLGLSSGPVSAGGRFFIMGGWSCYVEKTTSEEVYVELKKISDTSTNAYINAAIPYYDNYSNSRKMNGFSYRINYKSEKGMKAYLNFLKGHIDEIEPIEGIISIEKGLETITESNQQILGLTTPVISLFSYLHLSENSQSEEVVKEVHATNDNRIIEDVDHSLDNEIKMGDDINSDEYEIHKQYVVSLKRKDLQYFGRQTKVDKVFLISNERFNRQMQIYYEFVSSNTSSKKLEEIRDSLISTTGLNSFLDFKVKKNEKLDFTQVKLAINFGRKIVDTLTTEKFKFIAALIELRPTEDDDWDQINEAIDLMSEKNLNQKTIAKIGQKFWDSPFLFQFAINLVKTCGGNISYEVSGKRISRLLKSEGFPKSKECILN